ncbi:MAG: acyl-CoA thioesterase [Armatimonadetes bacterium]|nr:acyl-CoA thioesterase [Armatimonadota bacterium]
MIEIPSDATRELVRIRYGETDRMGHAYYANYLFWFEQARGAWCRDRGFDYKDLEDMGVMLPVVEAHVRYKGEILYDDVIEIAVWVSEIKRAALRFDYAVFRQGESLLLTDGYTWHVTMGTERKAISVPPHVREMMQRPRII